MFYYIVSIVIYSRNVFEKSVFLKNKSLELELLLKNKIWKRFYHKSFIVFISVISLLYEIINYNHLKINCFYVVSNNNNCLCICYFENVKTFDHGIIYSHLYRVKVIFLQLLLVFEDVSFLQFLNVNCGICARLIRQLKLESLELSTDNFNKVYIL